MTGRVDAHPAHEPLAPAELFDAARRLWEAGQAFALVTVVDRAGPVSAHVGDKAVVTPDGRVAGWVGGSCSRSVVLREVEAALRNGRPRLVRLGTSERAAGVAGGLGGAEYVVAPMTCASGGELLLYIEPHRPGPGLVVFGATPIAGVLSRLGRAAGYRVLRVLSRDEAPEAEETGARLLDELAPEDLEGWEAAVVATQGLYDEESLECALRAGVPYVGLVASRRRAQAVRAFLEGRGWSPQQLDRVHSPVGLDIGGVTADEVAISILAEIVAWRHGRIATGSATPSAVTTGGPAATVPGDGRGEATGAGPASEVVTATDPVCGMAVAVATARYTAEYDGRTYYFCCPACRRRFLEHPQSYALAHG